MWIISSWSLMACHCLCQLCPLSPSWLQCGIFFYKARPSAYQGTLNPGQGTQNIFPSNLSEWGINSLCSVRKWALSISTASNVFTACIEGGSSTDQVFQRHRHCKNSLTEMHMLALKSILCWPGSAKRTKESKSAIQKALHSFHLVRGLFHGHAHLYHQDRGMWTELKVHKLYLLPIRGLNVEHALS